MNSGNTIHPITRGALEYIRNAGGSPEVAWFDDDHEPIGPQLRADLQKAGWARQRQDHFTETARIELTEAGTEAIRSAAT